MLSVLRVFKCVCELSMLSVCVLHRQFCILVVATTFLPSTAS